MKISEKRKKGSQTICIYINTFFLISSQMSKVSIKKTDQFFFLKKNNKKNKEENSKEVN